MLSKMDFVNFVFSIMELKRLKPFGVELFRLPRAKARGKHG